MRTIHKGDQGEIVSYLQKRLNRHGFHVEVDGDFGPETDTAVEQFQLAQGLEPDGLVGPKTWAALQVESFDTGPEARSLAVSGLAYLRQEAKAFLQGEAKADERLRVLETAFRDLGARERPDGSNGGPQIAHLVDGYQEHWKWAPGQPKPPWCAIAVSQWIRYGLSEQTLTDPTESVWDEAKADWAQIDNTLAWADTPMGEWFGGVGQWEDWAKGRKVFTTTIPALTMGLPAYVPAGAIFTMGRGGSNSDPATSLKSGHCGLVVADKGQEVLTIEGNVSNAVQYRMRPKKQLRGYIAWWEVLK